MGLYVGGTSLLLHGNGADGSTVFTDETGKTVTPYGNARISTAQSKFGGSSMSIGGAADGILVADSPYFNFGNKAFAIEFWVNTTASNLYATLIQRRPISGSTGEWQLVINSGSSNGRLNFSGGGFSDSSGTISIADGLWHHIAIVRKALVYKVYVDGVLDLTGSVVDTISFAASAGVAVGYDNINGNRGVIGYFDDVRITYDIELYTANFTPPTAPLEIHLGTQIAIQAHDPGITKLAKYDPSQIKPVISEVKDDLQDRWPYGPYKTPAVQFEFKGRGRITGTVAEKALPANTPLRRLVRLHREPDGAFVKAVWSDNAGNYTFNGVRADHKFFVTTFDYAGTYRAVIADNLTPDVLP